MRRSLQAAALMTCLVALACDDDGDDDKCANDGGEEHSEEESCETEAPSGPPTESVCPTDSMLTYEGFGQPFMQMYCTRCHSAEVSGDARMSAPADHNFDTLEEILPLAEHIDEKAGAGPAATNEFMPIGAPTPTLEERRQLSEWLACELEAL